MNEKLTLIGKIIFEPPNLTTKHHNQSSWKKIAFVELDGDLCEYYGWFINKRYNIILNKSIRKPHITVINDSIKDLRLNDTKTEEEVEILWNTVKEKWDGKEIEATLDVDMKTTGEYWYLSAPHDMNEVLINIRKELSLGDPYYKLHMSIGYPHPRHEEYSNYISNGIKNGFIFG